MVPAGTFECLDFQGKFASSDPSQNYPERILHNCYAKEVGIVFQNVFFASNTTHTFERRLSAYHLE